MGYIFDFFVLMDVTKIAVNCSVSSISSFNLLASTNFPSMSNSSQYPVSSSS